MKSVVPTNLRAVRRSGGRGRRASTVPAAAADPIADFYSGKTVQVLIGFSPGGGYDIYGRTLARYMGGTFPAIPNWCRRTCRAPAR